MTTKTTAVKEKAITSKAKAKTKTTTRRRSATKASSTLTAKTCKTRRKSPASAAKKAASANKQAVPSNLELGKRGEAAAVSFLGRRGYSVVCQNWTCPAGEADIIARDGNAIVFVEVKTRSGAEKGLPSEAVDKQKRAKYEKIAAMYLQEIDDVDVQVRFDVISILVIAKDRALLRHHVNAFGVA